MMNRNTLQLGCLIALLTLMIYACVPPTNEVITDVEVSNSDLTYQRIYNHQDAQNVDSLLSFFSHPNPAYRLTAVNAMASLQSDAALDSLVMMLADPILEVRSAAAYAIGQSGKAETVDPLMNAFIKRDTVDVDNRFNSTILEAVGKTGNKSLLDAMAAALALRKVSDPDILKILQSQLIVEKDYRVKVNILRSLGSYNYIDNIDLIIDHLEDDNIHVANAAAQYLVDHGNRDDAEIYKSFATKKIDHTVRAKIYASVLKNLPAYYTNSKSRIRTSILGYLDELKDQPYIAKHYVAALGFDSYNYAYLKQAALDSGAVVVRTTGMEALSNIVSDETFATTFRSRSSIVKNEILKESAGVS